MEAVANVACNVSITLVFACHPVAHNLLDGMSTYQSSEIIQLLRDGRAFRVVGDNFNLLIKV